jgi:phosphoenolpyruvate carboxylase
LQNVGRVILSGALFKLAADQTVTALGVALAIDAKDDRAASELDQLVNEITSGEHAMRPPDRAQATASVGAYEHSALEKYRRALDAVMEILQRTRAEQPCDLVNAGEPEINDSRSALDPSNHQDKRTTTLQAIEDELRQTMESLRSANDAICSADQTIEMLTQALVARHTGDPTRWPRETAHHE